ncbi:MAG: LAGLIDADG family homing endonuclease [Thaumarchaeota archaeon]|nr:LAGLIDADG family homing endonuclease [Nitrososphaerota archaeon]
MSESLGESNQRQESSAATEFTEAEREVLTYLRNSKRVDLRWLSEEQKGKIKTVLDGLHNEKKISLLRVSKEVGRSYTAIWGLCRALNIHTRSVAEADKESAASRSKHKRTPFKGSPEDAAYMVGFKNGDLTAWQVSGTAVMVTSTTTHPAFARLFHDLFDKYGKVYEYPMYDGERGYKWKLGTRLDNSFQFLLTNSEDALTGFASSESLFLSWLAGLLDADGHINIGIDRSYTRVRLDFGSINLSLLGSLKKVLLSLDYSPTGPYAGQKAGFTTPRGITYNSDMWRLDIQGTADARRLLTNLPIRHLEKIQKKELALSLQSSSDFQEAKTRLGEIKSSIRAQVSRFIEEAQRSYEERQKHKIPRQEGDES